MLVHIQLIGFYLHIVNRLEEKCYLDKCDWLLYSPSVSIWPEPPINHKFIPGMHSQSVKAYFRVGSAATFRLLGAETVEVIGS